jgi:hypothetical protein
LTSHYCFVVRRHYHIFWMCMCRVLSESRQVIALVTLTSTLLRSAVNAFVLFLCMPGRVDVIPAKSLVHCMSHLHVDPPSTYIHSHAPHRSSSWRLCAHSPTIPSPSCRLHFLKCQRQPGSLRGAQTAQHRLRSSIRSITPTMNESEVMAVKHPSWISVMRFGGTGMQDMRLSWRG